MYDGGVGPGSFHHFPLRFDSPDDVAVVWGAKAKPPVFDIGWRLCCEHCGCAMDTRSYFAEIDLHILTFDIPDDVLERAVTLWFGSVLP